VGVQLIEIRRAKIAPSVGWNWNPEENVTTNETNKNPTKKTFSRDTAKEG
jgi:hypothetical protein